MARRLSSLAFAVGLLASLFGTAAHAVVVPKENPAKSNRGSLASRAFVAAETSVAADTEPMESARPFAKAQDNRFENFKLLAGRDGWVADVDKRTAAVSYVEGAGIPWVPGRGNQLGAAALKALSPSGRLDLAAMEKAARAFLPQVADMLGVDPAELKLNQGRSGQPAAHVWFVDFDVTKGGRVVEGAHVVFRVNNGNLIQFGTENLPSSGAEVPRQKLTREQAQAVVGDFIGGFDPADKFMDRGSLHLLPVNVADESKAAGYEDGRGRGLMLTWEFIFHRPGEMGTWFARVNAATGQIVEFFDKNEYGQATGGTYKADRPAAEVVMPLPWANVASGVYTNSAGIFSGTTGTTTLQGQYVKITDSCGAISKAADANGLIALGSGTGTDCTTPGSGGAGNTHSARTQFYDVNRIKEKGRGWLPSNTWLQGSVTANVNLNQTCNAYWNGSSLNFFKSGGGCANTGELPGVSLHEFGHGLDTNDGSGDPPDNGTGEATGDFTAALITHQSCIGNGFLTSNCPGYGDSCSACTGVRDIDYAKHASNAPYTVSSFTQVKCPAPSANNPNYVGPCGKDAIARGLTAKKKEGHCESLVASQALWDLAARDMPSPGSGSAWATVDRLWYLSRSTATGSAFQCNVSGTTWTSDGCVTGGLFRVFRAIDDDNGNLADGTPHGGAIYASMNRHGMACASDAGASTTFAAVAPPAAPALTVTAGNNSASLSWSGSSGVYDVYRNETGCSAGFFRVANDVASTTYNDTNVGNGITYYYQVQAQPSGNEAASSAPSSCLSVTPTSGGSCTPPAAPTGVTASSSSQTGASVSWAASSGATSYSISRSTTSGGPYTAVGSSATTSFNDSGLTCNTTYYYVVSASNGTCASGNSTQASATTAACTTGGSVLSNNVPVTGISGATGNQQNWTMVVPAGSSNLKFTIAGGTGDADMYVKFGSAPTLTTYDCRPYVNGNTETCTFATPSTGTYYVMLNGYAAYTGVTLTGSYSTGSTNNPPVANFTSSTSGLTATFTNTSTDSDGTIASSSWNFGDSTTSTTTSPSHTYATGGTYTVTLTVTDNLGATNTKTGSVTVSGGTGGSELMLNGGFESGATSWTPTGTYTFSTTGAYPHSGVGYLIETGTNATSTATVYQQVAIPTTATGTMTFWLNVTSDETTTTTQYDFLYVEVRNTAGTLLGTLGTYTNLNKGTAGVYSQKTFDVSAYKGQTVRIQFRATNDSSLATAFRIDDVSVK